jgi:hypothetical protein
MSQMIPAPNFTFIRPGYIRFIFLLGLSVLCSLILIDVLIQSESEIIYAKLLISGSYVSLMLD